MKEESYSWSAQVWFGEMNQTYESLKPAEARHSQMDYVTCGPFFPDLLSDLLSRPNRLNGSVRILPARAPHHTGGGFQVKALKAFHHTRAHTQPQWLAASCSSSETFLLSRDTETLRQPCLPSLYARHSLSIVQCLVLLNGWEGGLRKIADPPVSARIQIRALSTARQTFEATKDHECPRRCLLCKLRLRVHWGGHEGGTDAPTPVLQRNHGTWGTACTVLRSTALYCLAP